MQTLIGNLLGPFESPVGCPEADRLERQLLADNSLTSTIRLLHGPNRSVGINGLCRGSNSRRPILEFA